MTRITFLGTGTSHGVPMIGCNCKVCTSNDSKDKRYRSSILIEKEGTAVVIDTGYEFRLQCLRAGIKHLDGIIYTHAHSDHLMGLDDLRVFTKETRLPIYSFTHVIDEIEMKFPYAFQDKPKMGLPQLDRLDVKPYEEFTIGSLSFLPVPVMHGDLLIAGYRFGNCAYITDVSDIMADDNRKYLENIDVLIIGALRETPHATHFSFQQAIDAAKKIGAKDMYFTHMNHENLHEELCKRYFGIAKPAYDGLVLEVDD